MGENVVFGNLSQSNLSFYLGNLDSHRSNWQCFKCIFLWGYFCVLSFNVEHCIQMLRCFIQNFQPLLPMLCERSDISNLYRLIFQSEYTCYGNRKKELEMEESSAAMVNSTAYHQDNHANVVGGRKLKKRTIQRWCSCKFWAFKFIIIPFCR